MVKIYSNTYPEMGVTSQEAKRRMEYEGPNEIAEKHPSAALRLARKFWGPSAWMVEVIALVSLIRHERNLQLFSGATRNIGDCCAAPEAESQSARAAGRALADRADAHPGQGRYRARARDFVPADMQLFEGVVQVDQSALTGETHEIDKGHDDVLHSGSTVRHGEA